MQAPSRIPERYISKTELPRKAELFANDFEPDYPAFKESDFPDYHLFSNSAGGKNTQPESDNEWDATETKVETEAVEGGVIRPGYNQRGHWSQDPDADNYGKDSAKYKLLIRFDDMWRLASETNKTNVLAFSDNLRDFDTNTICRAYYLNDSDGAGTMGHTGILLVNAAGEGIMFSYGALEKDKFDSPARMYVGIYSESGVKNALTNKEIHSISNSGDLIKERYNRWIPYDITYDNGNKMLDAAVEATVDMKNYDLILNNCDETVTRIFSAGGINMYSRIIPNITYKEELERAINKKMIELITEAWK